MKYTSIPAFLFTKLSNGCCLLNNTSQGLMWQQPLPATTVRSGWQSNGDIASHPSEWGLKVVIALREGGNMQSGGSGVVSET